MNQPRYYAGEFDNDRNLNAAFILIVVILLAVLTHYSAFWAGGVLAIEAREEAERIAAAAPKRQPAPVAKADWTQFSCKDLANICRKRLAEKMVEVNR